MNLRPGAVALVALVEAAVWCGVLWTALPAHTRTAVTARFWSEVATAAGDLAQAAGRARIAAEARYWTTVAP